MKFVSTRGKVRGVSLEKCISSGYAQDGGLFMPETIPKVAIKDLLSWQNLSFQDLAVEILSLFTGDEISRDELRLIIYSGFEEFGCREIVPIVDVLEEKGVRICSAELFHGQTYAFKDFGQQVLCRLLDFFKRKRGESATLLVSTTGDTGPAAIAAVRSTENLRIVCFYPKDQVSRLQEKQMTTVDSPNVHVYPFEGGGDDMDLPIKKITTDEMIQKDYNLCSVNSINIGRILAQTVHYFFVYLKSLSTAQISVSTKLVFSIPTGAMGNVTAGILAKQMGLPVGRFVCGVNANDILHRAVTTGVFRKKDLARTLSEAINIQVPYNFERVMYLLDDGKSQAEIMKQMEEKGSMSLSQNLHIKLKQLISTVRVNDGPMLQTIKDLYTDRKYLADPHTAVGIYAARNFTRENKALGFFRDTKLGPMAPKIVCLATAHPCKFEEAIREAMGGGFWEETVLKTAGMMPKSAKDLMRLAEVPRGLFKKGEDWPERLRSIILTEQKRNPTKEKRRAICGSSAGILSILSLAALVAGFTASMLRRNN
mmetsp:Transcript_31572/g.53400  ORF Transcript_31572/g.53400 Transcript_31572/m.53400 type:complete len:539 (-) Transcript_31572:210-1826(-)